MTTLLELLQQVSRYDVEAALRLSRPGMPGEDVAAHGDMVERLLRLKPMPQTDTPPITQIVITAIHRRGQGVWHDVTGLAGGSDQSYAIEFMRWEHWLDLPVKLVRCDLTPAQIVAHCIYEMTFCGFEQDDIQDRHDRIKDMAREVQAETDND